MSTQSDDILKILIIDDDEDDFILMRDLLTGIKNFRVELRWVSSDPEIARLVCSKAYDIVFVDYLLNPNNGLDLIRLAKKECVDVPMIMLTSWMDTQVERQALEVGASGYLRKKDITSDVLFDKILSVLPEGRFNQEI